MSWFAPKLRFHFSAFLSHVWYTHDANSFERWRVSTYSNPSFVDSNRTARLLPVLISAVFSANICTSIKLFVARSWASDTFHVSVFQLLFFHPLSSISYSVANRASLLCGCLVPAARLGIRKQKGPSGKRACHYSQQVPFSTCGVLGISSLSLFRLCLRCTKLFNPGENKTTPRRRAPRDSSSAFVCLASLVPSNIFRFNNASIAAS